MNGEAMFCGERVRRWPRKVEHSGVSKESRWDRIPISNWDPTAARAHRFEVDETTVPEFRFQHEGGRFQTSPFRSSLAMRCMPNCHGPNSTKETNGRDEDLRSRNRSVRSVFLICARVMLEVRWFRQYHTTQSTEPTWKSWSNRTRQTR